ncbi:hypothetical protein F4553_001166 [Allocatelliglobosispora scoriae]|uniref:Uncharacterized protein n=1 Tax=Allocatelliglobosispora scoriae TaxID=643052 RepID=A0A841BFC0_9ACTN|nr:hypothetical protein [Allocatelliglobosispora scoriae]MBB5867787.1 hypothetical protein [Allocatelliglobosispora scoriae]
MGGRAGAAHRDALRGFEVALPAQAARRIAADTGVRCGHSDFGGRAISGFDAIDGGIADDGNGHGLRGTRAGIVREHDSIVIDLAGCDVAL